jgi:putative tryptophan/tyrosine transport system substrate-binding protein
MIRRREFITRVGGAAAWSGAARAQQSAMPVIGFLNGGSEEAYADRVAAFLQGLNETGYVEGRNVTIEFRWADEQFDRLPSLAGDLVRRHVAMIVAAGGPGPAIAAKALTQTIPIVFTMGSDPVELGLVANLNRPGGNETGATAISGLLNLKRLELLCELAPSAAVIGVISDPNDPDGEASVRDLQGAGRTLGRQVAIVNLISESNLDTAFANLLRQRVGALFVIAQPALINQRDQVVALAARHGVPASYPFREFTAAGGLMSYGASVLDMYRQAGIYTGRILKGEKPGDLPVMQPTKFELVINLRAAKAIGLTIPETFLLRADEVIE